jgi:hypothetical protein
MTARADGAAATTTTACPAAAPPEPTEAEMMRAILDAARFLGWRVAHFRPARTSHGWRTPVEGDGAGFPDAVMVNPRAGLTWWIELKARRGRLTREQERWGFDLAAAGQSWRVVRGRAGLTDLLDDMAIRPRTAGARP